MPNGTFFQTPTGTAPITSRTASSNSLKDSSSTQQQPNGTSASTASPTDAQEAVNELTSSIDDFISEVETKFKVVSNEILSKLDDMALRCDRIESELQLSPSVTDEEGGNGSGNGVKAEGGATA